MTFTDAQVTQAISAWLFPFFRIGAVVTVAPIFSTRAVPARYRVLLAAAVTVLIAPLTPSAPTVDPFSGEAVVVIAQQVAIGVSIGFVLQLAFAALVFGGQVVAYGMGLGFAHLMDPQNGVEVPTVSQFYMILATLAFLLADGHLRLIALLVQSFETVPVSAEGVTRANLWELAGWGRTCSQTACCWRYRWSPHCCS